jgi:hypothetical protein
MKCVGESSSCVVLMSEESGVDGRYNDRWCVAREWREVGAAASTYRRFIHERCGGEMSRRGDGTGGLRAILPLDDPDAYVLH